MNNKKQKFLNQSMNPVYWKKVFLPKIDLIETLNDKKEKI